MLEKGRIPAQVNDIEKGAKTVVIDPEHSVVICRCVSWIVVQQLLHFLRPVSDVQLRVIATPSYMGPRILEHD